MGTVSSVLQCASTTLIRRFGHSALLDSNLFGLAHKFREHLPSVLYTELYNLGAMAILVTWSDKLLSTVKYQFVQIFSFLYLNPRGPS